MHRDMSDETRIQYLRSQITEATTIYDAATRILAAQLIAGKVTDDNENEMLDKSITMALELAIRTDRRMAGTGGGPAGGI